MRLGRRTEKHRKQIFHPRSRESIHREREHRGKKILIQFFLRNYCSVFECLSYRMLYSIEITKETPLLQLSIYIQEGFLTIRNQRTNYWRDRGVKRLRTVLENENGRNSEDFVLKLIPDFKERMSSFIVIIYPHLYPAFM